MLEKLGRGALAVLAALVLGSCSSGDDDGPDGPRQWDYCESRGDSCVCEILAPGWSSSGFGERACSGFNCCLLTENPDESTALRCECFEAASCEAEAESRRGAMQVDSCPPGDDVIFGAPTECAEEGENCSSDYLADQDLSGCCDGTVCLANDDQVRVCQEATDELRALANACERAAQDRAELDDEPLEVTEPTLDTSVGVLTIDAVGFTANGVGPGGCLNRVQMDLGDSSCRLSLSAERHGGAWQVTNVSASFAACSGYMSERPATSIYVDDPAVIPFELEFTGLACDGHLIFESYCAAGTFDWHLSGTLEGVMFNDSHLIVEGVVCGFEPDGTCDDAP